MVFEVEWYITEMGTPKRLAGKKVNPLFLVNFIDEKTKVND